MPYHNRTDKRTAEYRERLRQRPLRPGWRPESWWRETPGIPEELRDSRAGRHRHTRRLLDEYEAGRFAIPPDVVAQDEVGMWCALIARREFETERLAWLTANGLLLPEETDELRQRRDDRNPILSEQARAVAATVRNGATSHG